MTAVQSGMKAQFLWDKINFENLTYTTLNEQVQYLVKFDYNSLKWVLNVFSQLIIINKKNPKNSITYCLLTKILLKLCLE